MILGGTQFILYIFFKFEINLLFYVSERVWMVQTEQQYICIHQCLLAVLEGKENISSSPREIHDNQGYEGKTVRVWKLLPSYFRRAMQKVASSLLLLFYFFN